MEEKKGFEFNNAPASELSMGDSEDRKLSMPMAMSSFLAVSK